LLLSNVVVHSSNGYVRVTGANGAYIMNVTPGTYSLAAELPGLGTNTIASLTVTNGEVRVQNFSLGTFAPDIRTNSYSVISEGCKNGVIDSGEAVTLNIGLKNVGPLDSVNLVATLLQTNGIISPSAPQNYGVLSTNGAPVARPFTFIPVGTCGGTVPIVLQLQNDGTNLSSVTLNLPLGGLSNIFSEKFDGVAAPALPAGWTTATSGSQSLWITSSSKSDTAPNAAFATDTNAIGVDEIVSPPVAIPASSAQLSFRHNYATEAGFDGGVLEIKIGAGSFADILSAGGSFAAGGYNDVISTSFGNPLGGRSAWSGISGSFITTIVNLPAAALGKTVQFKWRCGSDSSVGGTGWFVDSVNVSAIVCCSTPTPPLINPPSLTNSQFQFSLLGTPGSNYIVQASTNLSGSNWVPIATNPAPFSFIESNGAFYPQRFYRAVVAP
jgi:hypothetical protein